MLKSLVVEDEFISRCFLHRFLSTYGEAHVAVDGEEALTAFSSSLRMNAPYDLVCLDIMMPGLDGQEVLRELRDMERQAGIAPAKETKVIMTTALGDPRNVIEAYYKGGATAYMTKPLALEDLRRTLHELGLV